MTADQTAGPWVLRALTINGPRGRKSVEGYDCGGALVVTPNVNANANGRVAPGYVITHRRSGRAPWPNVFPVEIAKTLCRELLALDGWDRGWQHVQRDASLRRAAEAVARKYL
jgi:hypothetical protein